MKFRRLLVCVLLAAPALSFAASKEITELQRDVALLQQQLRDLQRSQDEKLSALLELTRQAVDTARYSQGSAHADGHPRAGAGPYPPGIRR